MDDQDVIEKTVYTFLDSVLAVDKTENIFLIFESYFGDDSSFDDLKFEKLRKSRGIIKQISDWIDKRLCEIDSLSNPKRSEHMFGSDNEIGDDDKISMPVKGSKDNNIENSRILKTTDRSAEYKVIPLEKIYDHFHESSNCPMSEKQDVDKDALDSFSLNRDTVYRDDSSLIVDTLPVTESDQSQFVELNNELESDKAERRVVDGQQDHIPANADIHTDEVALQSEKNGENMKTPTEKQSVFDTKNMWEDIPTRESITIYYKADKDSKCLDPEDGLRLIAASVRGRSHAHVGSPRDDDFYIHHSDNSGWNILAVADGAGSCKFSRRGSQIVVKCAVEALCEKLENDEGQALLDNYPETEEEKTDQKKLRKLQNSLYETLVKAAYSACEAINKQANDNSESVKDFSTTLLLAAHKKTERGHFVISFWVGDGAIALYQENGACILMGEPDGGEYAGQTRFLDERIFNDPALMRRVSIKVVEDFTALIMATDGVTDPNFNSDAELAEPQKWDDIWSGVKWGGKSLKEVVTTADGESAKQQLEDWSGFFSPGNHDDRTIAVLTHLKDGDNA